MGNVFNVYLKYVCSICGIFQAFLDSLSFSAPVVKPKAFTSGCTSIPLLRQVGLTWLQLDTRASQLILSSQVLGKNLLDCLMNLGRLFSKVLVSLDFSLKSDCPNYCILLFRYTFIQRVMKSQQVSTHNMMKKYISSVEELRRKNKWFVVKVIRKLWYLMWR